MATPTAKFPHGQDAGKILFGLWLLVSPWMLNYTQASVAVWNSDVVGLIVAGSSLAAILKFTEWEEWINIVAGIWLIASPWILDYGSLLGPTSTLPVTANNLAVGLCIVILSLWELNVWEAVTGNISKYKM